MIWGSDARRVGSSTKCSVSSSGSRRGASSLKQYNPVSDCFEIHQMKCLDEAFLPIDQTKWSDHPFGKQKGSYKNPPKKFFFEVFLSFGILPTRRLGTPRSELDKTTFLSSSIQALSSFKRITKIDKYWANSSACRWCLDGIAHLFNHTSAVRRSASHAVPSATGTWRGEKIGLQLRHSD